VGESEAKKQKRPQSPEPNCHPQSQSQGQGRFREFRGAGKKKIDGPPRAFAKSQTHPTTIRHFFSWFFFRTFLGVSRQGEFKNTIQIFLQKVHVEKYFQYFDKKIDVSFSSTFFVLSCFRVFFSDGSSKTLQKTFCKKNRVEKFLQKIRPKIQNRLFLEIVLSRFWAFLDEGSSKTR
jgi:hypothetical protein